MAPLLCFLFFFLITLNENSASLRKSGYYEFTDKFDLSENSFLPLQSQNMRSLKGKPSTKKESKDINPKIITQSSSKYGDGSGCVAEPTSITFAEVHFEVSCPMTSTLHITYSTGPNGKQYQSPDFVVSAGENQPIVLSNLVPSSLYSCRVGSGACDFTTAPFPKLGATAFNVLIPGLQNYDIFPIEYTCDNPSASNPPVAWTNVPHGTQDLFLTFTEGDPFLGVRYVWAQYNIDPTILSGLDASTTDGLTAVWEDSHKAKHYTYHSPCASGPGWRPILLTLYALQYPLQLAMGSSDTAASSTAEDFVNFISNNNLAIATATFRVMYCHIGCS